MTIKTTATTNIVKATATQNKALMNKFLPTGSKISQSATVVNIMYNLYFIKGYSVLLPNEMQVLQTVSVNETIMALLEQLETAALLTQEQETMLLNMRQAKSGSSKMSFKIEWNDIDEIDILSALCDINSGVLPYMVG